MRIYQFENFNPEHDTNIALMFLIGNNDFRKPASSLIIRDNKNYKFDWGYDWEWVTKRSNGIVNSFKYVDDL